jgi:hypothetical protein
MSDAAVTTSTPPVPPPMPGTVPPVPPVHDPAPAAVEPAAVPAAQPLTPEQAERLAELRGMSEPTPAEQEEMDKLTAERDAHVAAPVVVPPREINPALKIFILKARDLNEPPFFQSNMAHTMLVAAEDVMHARRIAMTEGAHWGDDAKIMFGDRIGDTLSTCEELKLYDAGVLAVMD